MARYIFPGTAKSEQDVGRRTNCHIPTSGQRLGYAAVLRSQGTLYFGDWMTSGGCYCRHLMELRGAPLRGMVTSARPMNLEASGQRALPVLEGGGSAHQGPHG